MNAPWTVLLAHLGRLLPVADDGQGVDLLHEWAQLTVYQFVLLYFGEAFELFSHDEQVVVCLPSP